MTHIFTSCRGKRFHALRISLSSASTSPIFLLVGVACPELTSSSVSPSVHSVTSHSTCTPEAEWPPRCCLKRPSLVFRTISSNHGAPRDEGSDRTTVRLLWDRDDSATLDVPSSSLLSLLGRNPISPSRSWSSSNRLPTVNEMCSASSRVRSFQDESCVPQYPQNTRRWSDMSGETKDRRMLDRVSSGNCAKVADVYHGRGTRSQRVRGLAERCPGR
jgi:hypothetical protein